MTCRPRTTAAAQREPREPRAMAVPPCETRELCVEGRAESPCNEGTSYSAVFLLLIDAQDLLRRLWKTYYIYIVHLLSPPHGRGHEGRHGLLAYRLYTLPRRAFHPALLRCQFQKGLEHHALGPGSTRRWCASRRTATVNGQCRVAMHVAPRSSKQAVPT